MGKTWREEAIELAEEGNLSWRKRKLELAHELATIQTDERVAKALIERYTN